MFDRTETGFTIRARHCLFKETVFLIQGHVYFSFTSSFHILTVVFCPVGTLDKVGPLSVEVQRKASNIETGSP